MARKTAKDKPAKTEIVAFKVEESLALFLNKLQNKSDFIRKAIIAQMGMTCPLCNGSGVVPSGLHAHYEPLLTKHAVRKCDGCGLLLPLPRDLRAASETDRPRVEQFFRGGPWFCPDCYSQAPPCDDCGWHIPLEQSVEHHREAHAH